MPLSVLLKTLTSWAQCAKTLQETVTFTAKKKIVKIIQIQEAIAGEIKQPKTLI